MREKKEPAHRRRKIDRMLSIHTNANADKCHCNECKRAVASPLYAPLSLCYRARSAHNNCFSLLKFFLIVARNIHSIFWTVIFVHLLVFFCAHSSHPRKRWHFRMHLIAFISCMRVQPFLQGCKRRSRKKTCILFILRLLCCCFYFPSNYFCWSILPELSFNIERFRFGSSSLLLRWLPRCLLQQVWASNLFRRSLKRMFLIKVMSKFITKNVMELCACLMGVEGYVLFPFSTVPLFLWPCSTFRHKLNDSSLFSLCVNDVERYNLAAMS